MKIFGYSDKECLTFFILVVVGYFIAKMFSQKCNGFSVGAQVKCDGASQSICRKKLMKHGCIWKDKDKKCVKKNAPALKSLKSCDQCISVKSLEKNKGNICVENKPPIVGMNCELDEQCNVGIDSHYCKNGKCAYEDRGRETTTSGRETEGARKAGVAQE